MKTRGALGLILAFLVMVAVPSHRGGAEGPASETLTFVSTADTYVDSSEPRVNYDEDDRLRVDDRPIRIAYLRFDVTGVDGRPVESARLRLEAVSASVLGGTVHLISDTAWDESTVTYNTRPAVDGPGLDTLGAVSPGAIVEFNLDGEIPGDGTYSFAIDTTSTDGVSYVSDAAPSGQPPELILSVASGPNPTVTIVQPPDDSTFFVGDSVPLQATVVDDFDTGLEDDVQWSSDVDGFLGTGGSIVPTLSEGSHVVTAAVTDSDQLPGSDQIGITIVPPPGENTEPLVSITSPLDAQTFTTTQAVPFSGAATDLEDGVLTDELSWISDQDGPIGQGGSFSATLSEGTHEVTASVTDSEGLEGTAAVSFNVVPPDALEFIPTADTYVDEKRPTTNYGSDTLLRVDADSERITFLRFAVTGVGARTVTQATLRMEADADAGSTSDSGGTLHTISDTSWGEGTLTYDTRPPVDGPALGTAGPVTPGDLIYFDVTGVITGDGIYNFALVGVSIDGVKYRSREAGTPTLILELTGNPPAVTITAPANGAVVFTNELPLGLSGTATDTEDGDLGSAIAWTSDLDGALGTGASITAGGLSVGQHTIRARATDSDGLTGQSTIVVHVRTPNVAPQVTITAPADGTTVAAGTSVVLSATAVDDFDGNLSSAIGWTSSLDGSLGTGATLTVVLSEGTHTLTASVIDSDGALGMDQVTVTVTATAPVVTVLSPAHGAIVFGGNPVVFSGTALDAKDGNLSGALTWTSNLNGPIGAGATFSTTTLSQGTHTVTAAVTDTDGLPGQAQVTVIVRPPNALPTVTLEEPADGATLWTGEAVALSGTATDVEDGDMSSSITWTSSVDGLLGTGQSLTVPSLSAGTHTLTASVVDSDGAPDSASVTVNVGDTTLTVVAEADTYVDSGTPDAALGAEESFRVDASPLREVYLRFTVTGVSPLAVEQAILRLTVGPDKGNSSESAGTVHSMTDDTWTEAGTTFANRPAIDGPALATGGAVATNAVVDFDVTAAVSANGTYNFAMVTDTSDAAGYRSREAGSGKPLLILTLTENGIPVVGITSPPNGTTVLPTTPLSFIGTAADPEDGNLNGEIQWSSDLQGALGTGSSTTVTLDPGQHTITAEVTDSSGANGQAQITVNVGSAPVVVVTAPADGTVLFTDELPLTLSGTATDVEDGVLSSQIEWTSDLDGPLGTGASIAATLSVGQHMITAAATDTDDLTGQAMVGVRVRAPNVAPEVTITAPADGSSVPAGTTIGLTARAIDDFDGNISGAIVWTSNADGTLGTGGTLGVVLTEGTHTVTAQAIDSDGAPGTDQVTVTVTATPPVVTVLAPANGTNVFGGNFLTFSGTAMDATDGDLSGGLAWTSSLDGSIGVGASFSTTALSVGTHTVTAAVTDTGGLPGQAQVTVVVRPPNDPPVLTIDTPTDGTTVVVGDPLVLTGTATDTEDGDLSPQIAWTSSVDGGLGTGASLSVTNLSPATHTLTASVTDLDGAPVSETVTVTVGESTLTFAVVADTYVDEGEPTVAFGTEGTFRVDASPVRRAYLRFDVTGVPPFAVEQAILRLTVGPESGAKSDVGGTVHSISDNTWTETTATFANAPVIDGPALATMGAVDVGEVVEWDVTPAVLADGSYSFAMVSTSGDGVRYNSREAGSGAPLLILTLTENNAPVVNITSPPTGTTVLPTTPVTLIGTATDVEDGNLSDEIGWSSNLQGALGTGASITVTLDPGQHTITAEVTDSSEAEGQAQIDIDVGSPPVVAVTTPADGTIVFVADLPLAFSGAATDVEDGVLSSQIEWTSDLDGPLGTGASIATTLSVGQHAITAAATDTDDLTGQAVVGVRVRTPNVAPQVTIVAPADGTSVPAGTTIGLAATAIDDFDGDMSGAVAWTSSIDGALGTGGTVAAVLTEGTHTVTASVTDSDGELDTDQVTVTVTATPPVVNVLAPTNGTMIFLGDPLTFIGAASDATDGDLSSGLAWTSDLDGSIGAGASFSMTTLNVGTHMVTANVTDSGGLPGQAQVTVIVRPPNDLPVLTIDTPADGTTVVVGETLVLTGTATDTEDGDLSPQIAWTSSVDGALGTGASLTVTNLSSATHTLTASVTDLDSAFVSETVTVTVGESTLTFVAVADTYVDDSAPTAAFGTEAGFRMDASPVRQAYLRFDVTGVPPFAVEQATLRLTVGPESGSPSDVGGTVHSISDDTWTEATTTFANAPVIDGPALATLGAVDIGEVVEWDVTPAVLADGTYSFAMLSTSSDGVRYNSREAGSGRPVLILDLRRNTEPVVSITEPVSGVIVPPGAPLTLTGTASDAEDGDLSDAIEWRSDQDGVLGTGATLTLSTLSDGLHVITAAATDSSEATTEATVEVIVEAPPVVTITSPGDGSHHFFTELVTLTATAIDSLDGDLSGQIVWTSSLEGALGTGATIETTTLSLGTHMISAVATDSRDLMGNALLTITVEVNDPPAIAIMAPPALTNFVEGVAATFMGAAVDPEQGDISADISWTSDRDGPIGVGNMIVTTSLSLGTHVVTATARDNRDLEDTDTVSVTIEVNDPAVVTITSPTGGATVHMAEAITFAGSATDPEDGDLTANLVWTSSLDGQIGTGAGFSTSVLSIGTHQITAAVTDTIGLPASAKIMIDIINDAPVVSIIGPTNGMTTFVENPVLFTGSVSDTEDGDLTAGLTWTSSMNGPLGTGSGFMLTTLSMGPHLISAQVTDSGGAPGGDSIILVVNAIPTGTGAPTVTITAPAPASVFEIGDPVTYTVSATDPDDGDISADVTWTSDVSGAFGTGASVVNNDLPIAIHRIRATVADSHGVVRFDEVEVEIEPENELPVVTITAPLDGTEVNQQDPIVFTGTATDLEDGDLTASLAWSSDLDGPVGTGGSLTVTTLSPGTHVITGTSTDSKNEAGTAQVSVTVHPIPMVTILLPLDGTGYLDTNPVSFFANADDIVEGDVTSTLTWTSDLDGPIGTGRRFTLQDLSFGTHTVTAAATNSRGATGTAQVTFVVSNDLLILEPVADATVDQDLPDTNLGLATDLMADAGPAIREAYLRFVIDGISGFVVHQAVLELTVTADGPAPVGGILRTFSDDTWTETEVTYNTRPVVDGPTVASVDLAVEAGDAVDFDVTGAMGDDGTYNFALQTASTDAVRYKSREAAATHPKLVVILLQPDIPQLPELTITSPATGSVVFDDTAVNFTATASDAEDGDLTGSISWQSDLDGALGTGASVSAQLTRGVHTITASAPDSYGLLATDMVVITVVDRPPLVNITQPTDGWFFPSGFEIVFSATASDDIDGDLSAGLTWSSHRDGVIGAGPLVSTATLSSGDHIVTASVTNSLGTTGVNMITIFIDQAPPEVAIQEPTDGMMVNQGTPITLIGTASDVENGDLSDELAWTSDLVGPLGTGAVVPIVLTTVGDHLITASVTDSHGFERTDEITLTVTLAPPVVAILSPPDGASIAGPVGFSGTAVDVPDGDLSGSIQWTSSVDGPLGTGATIPPTQLSHSSHVITAEVTDSNGLVGSTSISVVDGVASPVVEILEPAGSADPVSQTSATLGEPVTFTATAVDEYGGDISADVRWISNLGGLLGTGASIDISTLVRGWHVITAEATDVHGLTGWAQIVVVVTVPSGTNPPAVDIAAPSPGTTVEVNTPVTFSASAEDDLDGDISGDLSWVSDIDGFLGTGGSFTTTIPTPGTHVVTAAVASSTGLIGSDTVSVTVVSPSVSFDAVADTYDDATLNTTNFGTETELRVDSDPSQRAYLRFDVSGIDGLAVQNVVLRLQTTSLSSAASNHGGDLYSISDTTWDELALDYLTSPPIDGAFIQSAGAVASSETVDFDVTSTIAGDGIYSFAIVPVSTDGAAYRSREASVGRPQLIVFVEPPAPQQPQVEIIDPADQEILPTDVPSVFTATASDAQDGDLSVAVIWRSNVQGILGIGSSVTRALMPGPHVITATVNDVDGYSGTDLIHVLVGEGPVVGISNPAPGSVLPFGEPTLLSASAVDPQDGDLSFFLEWSSNIDGALSIGPSISVMLSPGAHTITARVTDDDGNTGTGTVSITLAVGDVGYKDFNFGSGVEQDSNRLTGSKPETKLWYTTDHIWWGVLYSPTEAAFTIHRLDLARQIFVSTGVVIDERPTSRQDALLDGNTLYVISRMSLDPGENRLLRYTYHPDAQTFVLNPGFPIDIVGRGTESMTIAKDSTGTLWVAYTLDDTVMVNHTLGSDTEWAEPFVVPVADEDANAPNPYFDDIAGVQVLDGAIGVFWSNQLTKADYLAVHPDGASPRDPASWTLEVAASGSSVADDHFNLKLASDGRLFAVIKTSRAAIGDTLIGLLVRSPEGTWSDLHHIANTEFKTTRPVVLLDEVRRKVHVFYSPFEGAIYSKTSDMDTISFPDRDGLGTPFITNATLNVINNATSTKQNLDPTTGLVVLASGSTWYTHNTIDPEPPPAVTIDEPADGLKVADGASVAFSGTAFSVADGALTSSLTWTSSLDGVIDTGGSFGRDDLSEGTHVITASVTDSSLAEGSATVTLTVETEAVPVVTIDQPGTGSKFLAGAPVLFVGTALDSLDGDLTGELEWTSDVDDLLGTGGSLSVTGLSLGTHTITAQVTDSAGLPGSASIVIELQIAAPPTVEISSPVDGLIADFGAAVPFAGTVTDIFDDNPTVSLTWTSDRDGAIGTGGSFNRSSLSLGVHVITASYTDSHGLSDSATVTITVEILP